VARSVRAPLGAWIGCAVALALLALVAYGVDAGQRADAELLERFAARDSGKVGSLAEFLVGLGDPLPLLLMSIAACAIALVRGRPLDAAAALVVVAGANLTTQLLKAAFSHPRFQSALGAEQLGEVPFPSGHVTAAASIAIAFAFVVPRRLLGVVALLGACLVAAVGVSVMVLDWHYPSDVLGGILVAAGWGFAVLAVWRALEGAEGGGGAQASSRPAISTK
jgi:membrane-associated phospholipid phosphatase